MKNENGSKMKKKISKRIPDNKSRGPVLLKKNDYSGWLVVEAEQDPSKANPLEYAKIGFNYLTKTCAESNLQIIK